MYRLIASILLGLFLLFIALIVFKAVSKPTKQEHLTLPQSFEFTEPKDWYLDSTMTEKRHIYYETQSKMK